MKAIPILFLILTSCISGSECDVEARGLCVIFESKSISEEHIIRSVDILQEELDAYFVKAPKLQNLFKKKEVVVVFVDYDMVMDCELVERRIYKCRDVGGVNYSAKDILVEWSRCIGYSAFIHELLHTVEYKLYNVGIKGSNHQGPLFNDNMVDEHKAIENKTNIRIVSELCSTGNKQ